MRSSWHRSQVVTFGGSIGEGLLLAALPLLAVSITSETARGLAGQRGGPGAVAAVLAVRRS